jgi:7-carboxy-7-deazaguanine synthase (Cx14CxxC type)
MTYSVKEIYYTLQGEGYHSGAPAVFCRFSGCNLWSGREEDRVAAKCTFCDTDFVGTNGPNGGKFGDHAALAAAVRSLWPVGAGRGRPLVVCTGGEPLLQLDEKLVAAFHENGFIVAVETNGTCIPPPGIDWICVSPKQGVPLALSEGSEIKLVYPQRGAPPEMFEDLDFEQFYLQPMDGPDRERNTQAAVAYCLQHPQWRLSLQTHKFAGIP